MPSESHHMFSLLNTPSTSSPRISKIIKIIQNLYRAIYAADILNYQHVQNSNNSKGPHRIHKMPLRRSRARPLRPLVLLPGQSRQILHEHTPEQSSYLRFPPSPTSLRAVPRTPLTPPPRLHLRTVLPNPPLSPQYRDTAPEVPSPWIWRCHNCGCVYKLGVTRRCLYDGHIFCSIPPRPPTPVSVEEVAIDQEESLEGSNTEDSPSLKRRQMQNVQKRRQKSRRQQRKVGCASAFDYSGWAEYNFWRRRVKTYYYEKVAALRRQNGESEEGGEVLHIEYATQKNCWNNCEFPSECHNNRLQENVERRQIQALFVTSERASAKSSDTEGESPTSEEDGERFNYQGKVMGIEEWEAELQRQKVAEFEKAEREMDELEKFAVAVYGSSESSSSSSSSTLYSTSSSTVGTEEMDIVDVERRGLEGEAQMVDIGLGPISASELEWEDEEIYGSEFANRKRKNSIQKIAQLTGLMLGVEPVERGYEEDKPRSSLKEGFTFGEWDDVKIREREREIEEEERSGGIYRRKMGKGEVAKFGDEEEEEDL